MEIRLTENNELNKIHTVKNTFIFVPINVNTNDFLLYYDDGQNNKIKIALFKCFQFNTRNYGYNILKQYRDYKDKGDLKKFFDTFLILGYDAIAYYNLQVIVKDQNIVMEFLNKCNDMIVNKKEYKYFFEDKNLNPNFISTASVNLQNLLKLVNKLTSLHLIDYFLPITSDDNLSAFLNKYYQNKNKNLQWKSFYADFIKPENISSSNATAFSLGLMRDVFLNKDNISIDAEVISDLQNLATQFPNLTNLIADYKRIIGNDKEVSQILNDIIQIRDNLSIDKSEMPELWQYTSMSSLHYLIKPIYKELDNNTDKKNTTPSLRFTNANQMNDPVEGKVLSNIFHFTDSHNNYLLSPFYISSATSSADSLPLWKQYADEGRGICLQYDPNYLKSIIQKDEINIFRMCYIDKDFEIKISGLDKESEVTTRVKEALKEIKDKIEQLQSKIKSEENTEKIETEKELSLIQSFLNARIGYLFKTMPYSYEDEYRISLNMKDEYERVVSDFINDYTIKLRAYIEDDTNNRFRVRYKSVILGPKIDDIDYIAPYIKWCDKGINIIKSKIKYR